MKDPELNIGNISESQYKLDNSLRPGASDAQKQQTSKDFKTNLDTSLNKIEKKRSSKNTFEDNGMWASLMSVFGQSISAPQAFAIRDSGLLELGQKAGQNAENSGKQGQPISISGSSSSSMNTQNQQSARASGKTAAASTGLEQMIASNIPAAAFNGMIPMTEFINGIGKFSRIFSIESIAGRIIDAAKLMKLNGRSELSIDIKPDLLGDLKLSIKSENGIISIQIFASAGAKALLDSNLADLQRSLASANIAVGGLEVFVNNNNNGKGFDEDAASTSKESIEPYQAAVNIGSFEALDRLLYEQKLGYNMGNTMFNIWG